MTASTSDPSGIIASLDRTSVRHTTTSAAGEVIWRQWGAGEPLVLLHGGTGSWMHWIRNIAVLSEQYRLLVPDLPGSGESGGLAQPVTAEHMAQSLDAGLTTLLGPQGRFSVAGFSLGGLIGSYLARIAGERVETLALVGSAGMGLARRQMEPLKSWRWLSSDDEKREIHRENLGILMIHDRSKIDDLALDMQAQNAVRSRVRGKHIVKTSSLAECLPNVKARLVGIWGEHDVTSPSELVADRLREFQPDAMVEVLPAAGHWVQFEAAEAFNRRLPALLAAARLRRPQPHSPAAEATGADAKRPA
jgi:pimeloyl-ACP methyl ester carboxylesterase